jgi:hypothetical protein
MFWFKRQQFKTGLLPDPRSPEERAKDYLTSELFEAGEIEWVDFEQWKQKPEIQKMLNELPVYSQDGSSSCVSQSIALIATINNWKEEGKAIKFSARGIYARRNNKYQQGMWFQDGAELFRTYGVVPEPILPSQDLNEDEMNRLDDYLPSYDLIGKIYASKNYFWVNSFDEVVQVISRGYPCQIGVRFGNGEWNRVAPQILTNNLQWSHSICCLPFAYFTYQGKRAVLIQDSWSANSGWNGRRILTEDWFQGARFMGGLWYEDMNNFAVYNTSSAQLPKYQWTRDLYVGSRGEDVKMLQLALGMIKDEQGYLFPLISQTPTGYYGGLTRSAVARFQRINNLLSTGIFDAPTRAKLNEMCK